MFAVIVLLSLNPLAADAAPITLAQLNAALPILQAGMQGIFAPTNITTINFLAPVVIPDPGTYLDLNTQAESNTVLGPGLSGQTVGAPVVTAYIVETLSQCGAVFNTGIAGCANRPGSSMVLEGQFLLAGIGDELFGHELGHNLGLPHVGMLNNLMLPNIGENNDQLNAPGQIGTVNASPLILNGPVGGIVTIQTVLLAAASVPEPSTAILMVLGIALMLVLKRRQLRA